jgi:hypothetical protein
MRVQPGTRLKTAPNTALRIGTKSAAKFYLLFCREQRGTGTMKRVLLALSAVAALMVSAGAASAQDIHIGPGGVRVGPDHRYYDEGRCRTIIDHHVNRWGNEVTVRRRVCD